MQPAAKCHRVGAPCLVRLNGGYPARWFKAVVIQAAPLVASITEADPVWFGCEVAKDDGRILVGTWHMRKALMARHEVRA